MTRGQAREEWEKSGFDYSVLTKTNRDKLRAFISKELEKHSQSMGDYIELRKEIKTDLSFNRNTLKVNFYNISCKGSWFSKRQAITFEDGFVGFCGWASDRNKNPFVHGFVKWVNWLRSNL